MSKSREACRKPSPNPIIPPQHHTHIFISCETAGGGEGGNSHVCPAGVLGGRPKPQALCLAVQKLSRLEALVKLKGSKRYSIQQLIHATPVPYGISYYPRLVYWCWSETVSNFVFFQLVFCSGLFFPHQSATKKIADQFIFSSVNLRNTDM